jgi:hypothetical protein
MSAPPFGDFFDFLDALFGGGNNNDNRPQPSDFPNFPPVGTGSGFPFPFPTATGAPFPIGTDSVQPFPYPGSNGQEKRQDKPLYVDYQLAAKAAPAVKKRELKYRQLGGSALPSFSLLDPNDTPTATEPATDLPTVLPTELPGLPTELPSGIPTELPGLPTGFPTPPAGGPTAPFPFPTGDSPFPTDAPFPTVPAGTGEPGFPGLPTTFGTVTRGPRPTAAPEQGQGEEEETENGNGWLEWINDLLTGGKGSQN